MLVDMRTYIVKAGTLGKQMKLYEEHGWATQRKHLGEPLAFMTTESGVNVNSYVHIWVYADAADRATKRAAMMADPAWTRYKQIEMDAGYLLTQENRLMTPTSFAPIAR
jgi:hypothetical protein